MYNPKIRMRVNFLLFPVPAIYSPNPQPSTTQASSVEPATSEPDPQDVFTRIDASKLHGAMENAVVMGTLEVRESVFRVYVEPHHTIHCIVSSEELRGILEGVRGRGRVRVRGEGGGRESERKGGKACTMCVKMYTY